MPGGKNNEQNKQNVNIEELRGKYIPTRRKLKASSRTFSIINNIKNLSEGSESKVDKAARRMTEALEAINELEGKLYGKDSDGKHPELTKESLDELNSLYFNAMKECDALIAGEGLSKGEKGSQKYKTYKKMATHVNTLLSLDTKSLGTANAKLGKTLPEVLSNARGLVLDAGSVEFNSVGNAQSSRHPVSVTLGNGKKVKGVFTEKDDFDPLKEYNDLFDIFKVDPRIEKFIDSLKKTQAEFDYKPDRKSMLDAWVNGMDKAEDDSIREFVTAYRKNPAAAESNQKFSEYFKRFNERIWNPVVERSGIGLLLGLARDYNEALEEDRKYGGDSPSLIKTLEILSGKRFQELKDLPGYEDALNILSNEDVNNNVLRPFLKRLSKFTIRTSENYEGGGITRGNLDTKNAACSVIASLLGCSGLIANAVTVKMKKNGQMIDGTFMELAEGTDLGYITYDRNKPENVPYYSISAHYGIDGENVMNDIFDLEIFDQIVGNIDCHGGNIIYDIRKENEASADDKYYLHGIKRIDMDNTFIEVPVGKGIGHLAGLDRMKVITKRMADRLQNLDGETLKFALRNFMKSDANPMGLSEKAIDCMVERLNDVKSHINYKSEKIKAGTLTVLDSEQMKKQKISELTPEAISLFGEPLGTSGCIVDAINDKANVSAYSKNVANGSVQLSKGGNEDAFSNVNANTEEKESESFNYIEMEKKLTKVKKGLDAVANVWKGSQQYADMNAKAGDILTMLREHNKNPDAAPANFDEKLNDALLEFKENTEKYFIRKRGQGQEAANNKNSMKRIAAAVDASDFIDDYIDQFAEKKIAKQEKQEKSAGPLL